MIPAFTHVMEHGRPPMLGDATPPWTYKGWLLYYVVLLHERGLSGDRWGHHLRILEAQHLIAEPIPRLAFSADNATKHSRDIGKWIAGLDRRSPWTALELLVDWLAWGLCVGSELPKLDEREHEFLYRHVNIDPWLQHPADHLGHFIAEQRGSGWNPHAFFPTPQELVQVMAGVSMEGCSALDTVHDPCVGTGRMLLEASNYSYRLSGQDIDPLMCKVTKINGALFAPWLAFPFPEYFFECRTADPD